ncbi:hypothetical protein [Cerasicoccus frondis]|nr:hypothetical protein [Cerasicoccus frondis]
MDFNSEFWTGVSTWIAGYGSIWASQYIVLFFKRMFSAAADLSVA